MVQEGSEDTNPRGVEAAAFIVLTVSLLLSPSLLSGLFFVRYLVNARFHRLLLHCERVS